MVVLVLGEFDKVAAICSYKNPLITDRVAENHRIGGAFAREIDAACDIVIARFQLFNKCFVRAALIQQQPHVA